MVGPRFTKEQLIKKIPSLTPAEYVDLEGEIRQLLTTEEIATCATLEQMDASAKRVAKSFRDAKKRYEEDLRKLILRAKDGDVFSKKYLDVLKEDPVDADLIEDVEKKMAQAPTSPMPQKVEKYIRRQRSRE